MTYKTIVTIQVNCKSCRRTASLNSNSTFVLVILLTSFRKSPAVCRANNIIEEDNITMSYNPKRGSDKTFLLFGFGLRQKDQDL